MVRHGDNLRTFPEVVLDDCWTYGKIEAPEIFGVSRSGIVVIAAFRCWDYFVLVWIIDGRISQGKSFVRTVDS